MDSLGIGLGRTAANEPDPVHIELAELMMPTAGNTVTLKSCRALAGHFARRRPPHRRIGQFRVAGRRNRVKGGMGMVAAAEHWRSAAACQFADPDLFFRLIVRPGL
jgi:hypothetical protein